MRRQTVHGVEIASGVEIPEDLAVERIVGAQMPIERSRKHHAAYGGGRSGLRGAASRFAEAGRFRSGSRPDLLSAGEVEGEDAASGFRVWAPIGQREIDLRIRCGAAELDAAERTAFADSRLPNCRALSIGIEAVNNARFLADHQQIFLALQRAKNGWGTNIKVAAGIFGATRFVGTETRNIEAVIGSELLSPEHFSGVEIDGDNRIAGGAGGIGVIISGTYVKSMANGINGWRTPDACAGGAKHVGADGVLGT